MEIVAKLFGKLLVFVYHCFDRIVVNGYLSGLSRPEQVMYLFRQVVGDPAVRTPARARGSLRLEGGLISPGAGSGASTASQTRPFASARRRASGPGTSRATCGAGFAKVWFARGFARTCSPG